MCARMIKEGLDAILAIMRPQPVDVGTYIKRLYEIMFTSHKDPQVKEQVGGILCIDGVTDQSIKRVALILTYYPRRYTVLKKVSSVAHSIVSRSKMEVKPTALARMFKVVGSEMDEKAVSNGK